MWMFGVYFYHCWANSERQQSDLIRFSSLWCAVKEEALVRKACWPGQGLSDGQASIVSVPDPAVSAQITAALGKPPSQGAPAMSWQADFGAFTEFIKKSLSFADSACTARFHEHPSFQPGVPMARPSSHLLSPSLSHYSGGGGFRKMRRGREKAKGCRGRTGTTGFHFSCILNPRPASRGSCGWGSRRLPPCSEIPKIH